jgi:hypothetical protein
MLLRATALFRFGNTMQLIQVTAPQHHRAARVGDGKFSHSRITMVRTICVALAALTMFSVTRPAAAADPVKAPGAEVSTDPLMLTVDQAIAVTRQRNLDFQVHTPWQILHGLLALRNNYTLKNGNEFVNAIDYISTSATYKGLRWFERTPSGARAQPYNGTPYDFEGHVNQTLAIIAMCNLPLTHTFVLADGSTVTMADMVRHAQWNVNSREEITWTLWFLTHYLDQDAQWVNSAGEQWSMERLVRMQTNANLLNAPCGGCHGLFAMAYARNAYLQKHGKLQGAWLEADQKLQQYIYAAQAMMNRDGSFATQYFRARGYSTDFNERIASSGHMIEWLMLALPRKRLDEPWLRLGVQTLAQDLIRNATQPADCGPLYHSLHALILYKQRIQPNQNPTAAPELALKPGLAAGPLQVGTPDGSQAPRTAQTPSGGDQSGSGPQGNWVPSSKVSATPAQPAPVQTPANPNQINVPVPQPGSESPAEKVEEKAPVQIAEEPRSVSMAPEATPPKAPEGPQSLKPATAASAPTLLAPPVLQAPALKPASNPETVPGTMEPKTSEPEGVKPVSADTVAESKESEAISAESLTPVKGGMPILKRSATRTQPTKKKTGEGEAAPESTSEESKKSEDSPSESVQKEEESSDSKEKKSDPAPGEVETKDQEQQASPDEKK